MMILLPAAVRALGRDAFRQARLMLVCCWRWRGEQKCLRAQSPCLPRPERALASTRLAQGHSPRVHSIAPSCSQYGTTSCRMAQAAYNSYRTMHKHNTALWAIFQVHLRSSHSYNISDMTSDGANPLRTNGLALFMVACYPSVRTLKPSTTARSSQHLPPNSPRHHRPMRLPSLPKKTTLSPS